jgi:hypothetical protein
MAGDNDAPIDWRRYAADDNYRERTDREQREKRNAEGAAAAGGEEKEQAAIEWGRYLADDDYRERIDREQREKRNAEGAASNGEQAAWGGREYGDLDASGKQKPLTPEEAEQERKHFIEAAVAVSRAGRAGATIEAERPNRERKREREMDFG